MTMSFLASVRRNQRQWMVVVTILSIFAFLADDIRGANRLSAGSTALFFAVLCAGGMSIIGYPRKHTLAYGLTGFIVGGSAALIGAAYSGPRAPVRTKFGNLPKEQIVRLQSSRSKVNQFLAMAAKKVSKPRPENFGDNSLSSMVAFSVLRHEADRLGVSVSDEAVNTYLQDATDKKLSAKEYIDILQEMGMGETELFDLIRSELEAQLVGRLMSPPADVQQFIGRTAMMSPEQLWDNYRKLNVRESLTVAAIPVSEFRSLVPEPSEADLRAYFDKRKSLVGDDRGNPGFLEPPKIKLAYLMADDLEAYEKGLTGATDQEVVDYYLQHREEFRVKDIPDSDIMLPGVNDPDTPADASSPANTATESKEPGPSDPPPTDKPAPDTKSDEKKEPAKEKDEEKPEQAKEEPKCGDEEPKKDPVEQDTAKPAVDEPKAPAASGEVTPPAPALPSGSDDQPKLTPPAFGPVLGPGHPPLGPMPPVRYRELDDELKLEIREKLLIEKSFAKMSLAADDALEFMMALSLKYLSAETADKAKLAATFADECKAYAEKKGLKYHETKEMTRMEMETSLDERIGGATQTVSDPLARQNVRNVAELVFDSDPSGRRYRMSKYAPHRADSPKARYAYWKVAEIDSKVPDLANKETHQLVLDSWKFEEARKLAEKRAQELAELAKKKPTDIADALSGQTINGTKESPPVVVRETPRFSWLRVSQSLPTMGALFPRESMIDGIQSPGSDFFKLVFEDMNENDVSVALNRPRTEFYVVRVHSRDGAAADGGIGLQDLQQQFLKERFTSGFPTPYDFIKYESQQFLEARWRQSFNKQFGITFEDDTLLGLRDDE